MLRHLTIKNYALIKHLELEPSEMLSVITGETGAGKSIMLGALGLLMGNRADTKVLWDENEKCITEAVFDIKSYKLKSFFKNEDLDYDENTVLRREISPGGKSRAFINDTPVTLEVLKRLGAMLMDVHSQHETLQLGNHSFQLQLIDTYAENNALREQYSSLWSEYQRLKNDYEQLQRNADSLRQEADYVRFQVTELQQASLVENEQEQLEDELKVKEHAEEIKTRFRNILEAISRSEYSVQSGLKEVRTNLSHVSDYSNHYATLLQRLESLMIELDDLESEIEKEEGAVDFDPERLQFVQERLSTIYKLLKKHRVTSVTELLTLQRQLEEKDNVASNLDEALLNARKKLDEAAKLAAESAEKLSDTRKKVLAPLSRQLIKLLQGLGIPDATMKIDVTRTELSPSGVDKIDILFSANKGMQMRPLAQVASGGEFSRVMFCIKYIMTERMAMPTLVLDEIDTGISGEVAFKLGDMMKDMAARHQVIAITHLPQIAAKGNAHYFVFKDNSAARTVTSVRMLDNKDRIQEIAKMIGGANPTPVALKNAKELLAL
jgi:DNA repair protein RecN (Recombination protein N)